MLLTVFSSCSLLGNAASICVLHHRDVKLKRDFVDVLSALAGFDILFLLATFFLFTLPTWSDVSACRIYWIEIEISLAMVI